MMKNEKKKAKKDEKGFMLSLGIEPGTFHSTGHHSIHYTTVTLLMKP